MNEYYKYKNKVFGLMGDKAIAFLPIKDFAKKISTLPSQGKISINVLGMNVSFRVDCISEADARGLMLIYLIENKLMEVSKE